MLETYQQTCQKCRGTGRHKLTIPLRQTLEVIIKLGPATIEEVHEATSAGMSLTGTHQRVARLMEYGLVEKCGESRPAKIRRRG